MQSGIQLYPGQRYVVGPDGYVRVWTAHLARRGDMQEFIFQAPLHPVTAPKAITTEPSGTLSHPPMSNRHEARRHQLKMLMRAARLQRAEVARICGVSVWTVIAWLRRADAPAHRTIPEPALRLLQRHAGRHE